MTGKQRAYLRSMCNEMPTILYVGKDGVTETLWLLTVPFVAVGVPAVPAGTFAVA